MNIVFFLLIVAVRQRVWLRNSYLLIFSLFLFPGVYLLLNVTTINLILSKGDSPIFSISSVWIKPAWLLDCVDNFILSHSVRDCCVLSINELHFNKFRLKLPLLSFLLTPRLAFMPASSLYAEMQTK